MCSTKAVGPQTKTCRARPNRASCCGVEPAAALAREGEVHIDPRRAPGVDLVGVEQTRARAGGDDDRGVDRAGAREPVPDHRPQRHDPRAAADQQQRPALVGVPGERAPARTAHLELIARPQLTRQPGRHLAVVEVLDAELEGVVLRCGGDRVRAAASGSRPRRSGGRRRSAPRGAHPSRARRAPPCGRRASRREPRDRRPSARGRRSLVALVALLEPRVAAVVVAVDLPVAGAVVRPAARARAPTWRSSRSRDAGRAAAPARRAAPRAARRRTPRPAMPCRR